jgi:hypothetical protein
MSKAKKAEVGISAKSLDEVIKKCKIDTRVWEVESYSSKELANGEFLWTVYFKKKKYVVDWEAFKKDLISYAPTPEKISYPKEQGGLLWEYSAPDLHLCKLAHKEETGENYDYKIAKEVFNKTLNDALEKVKPYKIDKIIFPCGNDFLNSDTLNNTTTAGTPQDSDSRHFKMFREGYKLLISAILKLKKVAPVEVLIVLGNHSTVSEMHIGELLEVYFRNDPDVTVNNSAAPRKYIKHGVNLIGFVHGNLEKHNKLPLLMATEKPREWASATTKVWHLGHLHQQKIIQEDCGVIVEILPSLSGADAYHSRHGYIGNTRASMSFLYDKKKGLVARFYHTLA